ncbi:MAG: DtxR family transcriptional regulator [candidate division Zixibacteria bacterium]|nr:DtxR family transcriptional regulator [candidate division Zixibacteria bacterium]
MESPFFNLAVFATITVLAAALLWPRVGFIQAMRTRMRMTKRTQLEDALKYAHECESNDRPVTNSSLAKALQISPAKTAELAAHMTRTGLIFLRDSRILLTKEGKQYALQIIRAHRLWERYLADETGLSATEWHREAEKQEHILTGTDADKLAAEMGDPVYDPHGDPIPTTSGKLPPKKGKPLTDLAEGEFGSIIHLEDEPGTIFAQLAAEGLNPGMQIRVLEKTSKRIHFIADGEEIVLAPVVAANVTILPLSKEDMADAPHDSLTSLNIGEAGKVTRISRACRGQQRRRLMDLGVLPGTIITAKMRSAGGDPIAYDIRGATIGLRNEQAEMIHIRRIEETVS